MKFGNALLRHSLVAAALLGGLAELALLQRWRLREWLLRQPR